MQTVSHDLLLNFRTCCIKRQTVQIWYVHHVSKNCANLLLPELRQIYTNFDNIWQKDGKEAKMIRGALTFHLT